METLIYLLKVNIAFVILLGAYRLMLRATPLFAANRAWLLLAPAVAFALPLITLPSDIRMGGVVELPSIPIGGPLEAVTTSTAHFSMVDILLMIYGAGVLVTLIILTIRYVQAWRISSAEEGEALSFFGRVVLPAGLEEHEERSLAAHERVHATKGHSYDILYFEILAAISWWDPVWRWALRDLRTVHELQADAVARKHHPDYALLLVSHAFGVPQSTLVNSFRSSNLKTRIAMLNRKSSPFSRIRYAVALPVVLVSLFAVSCFRSEVPPSPPPPPPPAAGPAEPVMDLSEVDVQPEYPGGMEAMYTFFNNTVEYPEEALKEKVQGKVYVQFTVDRNGKVKDVVLKRGPRADLNEEAMRAARAMPDWAPGSKDGQAVATRFIVPIAFNLKSTEPSGKD